MNLGVTKGEREQALKGNENTLQISNLTFIFMYMILLDGYS